MRAANSVHVCYWISLWPISITVPLCSWMCCWRDAAVPPVRRRRDRAATFRTSRRSRAAICKCPIRRSSICPICCCSRWRRRRPGTNTWCRYGNDVAIYVISISPCDKFQVWLVYLNVTTCAVHGSRGHLKITCLFGLAKSVRITPKIDFWFFALGSWFWNMFNAHNQSIIFFVKICMYFRRIFPHLGTRLCSLL